MSVDPAEADRLSAAIPAFSTGTLSIIAFEAVVIAPPIPAPRIIRDAICKIIFPLWKNRES